MHGLKFKVLRHFAYSYFLCCIYLYPQTICIIIFNSKVIDPKNMKHPDNTYVVKLSLYVPTQLNIQYYTRIIVIIKIIQ